MSNMEIVPIRVELLPNIWKEVGYRRTFTLELQPMCETVPADANKINFTAVFTTGGTKSYEAWHKSGACKNCSIDESGKIRFLFMSHDLEVGEMYCEFTMRWDNSPIPVPDTLRFATGVKLVSGCGCDPSELSIDLKLPYVNVGLSKEKLWEELAREDATLVIDKSHIPQLEDNWVIL